MQPGWASEHLPVVSRVVNGQQEHMLYTHLDVYKPGGNSLDCPRGCNRGMKKSMVKEKVTVRCNKCRATCTFNVVKPDATSCLTKKHLVKVEFPRKPHDVQWIIPNQLSSNPPQSEALPLATVSHPSKDVIPPNMSHPPADLPLPTTSHVPPRLHAPPMLGPSLSSPPSITSPPTKEPLTIRIAPRKTQPSPVAQSRSMDEIFRSTAKPPIETSHVRPSKRATPTGSEDGRSKKSKK